MKVENARIESLRHASAGLCLWLESFDAGTDGNPPTHSERKELAMEMEYELVQDEASEPKPYPITDMQVGDWAVIVGAKSSQCDFETILFGCAVMRLSACLYCVFDDMGQRKIDGTNYLVRNFKHGEYLKIRRA